MRATSLPSALLATLLVLPAPAAAQGVVVDEGRFAVSLNGQSVGTEDFTIRRAGLGRDDALFANATILLTRDGGSQGIAPLLRATPDGAATEYQVQVSGVDALVLRLRLAGQRFTAVIQSTAGEEQREFPAEAGMRVLEADVAHQYYFLREARQGSVTPFIEPRTRGRAHLLAEAVREEGLPALQGALEVRRIDFAAGDDRRTVWFDRLGRVMRVEIPARGYVAERVDP
jgi:hypothetical protein